ncbi:MAG TPA: heavy metal translocating P-type ATPase [Tenuifilum sp.]|uniref:heavy metal translocating P-type ATPase n=3 Tax=Tenuifilum sp. TaxID=2760880 RepID=UPI002C225A69|nr:heavy metal translocating P-type ATPase [Tenuifilum sp.]
MESKIFQVTGMSCAGCAISVETILKSQPGVLDAGVNFASSTVWVNFDSTITSPESLRNAVRSIGYDLVIESVKHDIEAEKIKHINTLRNRFIYSLLLSIPLMVVQMFFMHWSYTPIIALILSTPVIFWFGRQFHINASKQLKHFKANMDSLISISSIIAYLYSIVAIVIKGNLQYRGITPHLYFESAAMIITFVLLGKWLEERAKGKTASAIKKIMGLQPQMVWVKQNESIEEVPLTEVKKGMNVMVKPGERIPVDGIVTEGHSWVDESTITGEPIPAEKSINQKVWAGTINLNGLLYIRAEQIGSESVLGKIIETVTNAQNSKAPVQRLADRVAGIFVPIIIVISILTLAAWIVIAPGLAFSHGIIAAISVLAIACPCALGLATPTAVIVGIGKAAKKNILVRDAESLEHACKIDTIIFDKTGTLTEGRPTVESINWFHHDDKYPSILGMIEQHSNHPLAKSIVELIGASSRIFTIESFSEETGKGVKAVVDGKIYRVGSLEYLNQAGVSDINSNQISINGMLIGFAEESRLLATVVITDKIKDTARSAINKLKNIGIEPIILSGDNSKSVEIIAKEVGIERFERGMLPAGKKTYIENLKAQGKMVAMVGDGINDTEALSIADVSIAMGKGSDIAIDTSQVTILKTDLDAIPELITISKQTVKTIKQNLFWASIYNLISIPIAAGVLFPFTGLLLDPMIAALAMAFSSVSVVTNSLILKAKRVG